MTLRQLLIIGGATAALSAGLQAQSTSAAKVAGTPAISKSQMTGEVVAVDGNLLVVKMVPSGDHRVFNIAPGRQFMIDGQPKSVAELKPGTVLTATITTTTLPVEVRTTTSVTGKVSYVSGNYLILALPNGESRSFNVPDAYRFNVEGKSASVRDLRKGMTVSGSKIVSEPSTEISSETVVTGKAPK